MRLGAAEAMRGSSDRGMYSSFTTAGLDNNKLPFQANASSSTEEVLLIVAPHSFTLNPRDIYVFIRDSRRHLRIAAINYPSRPRLTLRR